MNPTLKRSGVFFCVLASLLMLAPQVFASEGASGSEMIDLDKDAKISNMDLGQPRYRPAPPRRRPRRRNRSSKPGLAYVGIGGLGLFNLSSGGGVTELIQSGGGFTLFAGARTSPYVALEVGLTGTVHDFTPENPNNTSENGVLEAATIDGKIFLAPESVRFEPFLQAGVGYYVLSSDLFVSTQLHGMGLQVGGGVDIRLNPGVALGVRGLYKGIYVNNDYDSDYWGVPAESALLNLITGEVNVQFYF